MSDSSQNIWIVVIAVLFAVLFFGGLGGMMGGNGYGYGGMMNWACGGIYNEGSNVGFGSMWVFGWIFMTLIIIALVLLIFWLIKQIQKPERRYNGKK